MVEERDGGVPWTVAHAYAGSEFFKEKLPARGVIEVTALPKGALIAIEAVATIE